MDTFKNFWSTNKIFKLFFLLTATTIISCNNHKPSAETDLLVICDAALDKIKIKDYKGIKEMFQEEAIKGNNDKQLQKLVDEASVLVNKYGLPPKEMIMFRSQLSATIDGPVQLTFVDYPFPAPKEKNSIPDRVISFGFNKKVSMEKFWSILIHNNITSDSIKTVNTPKIPFLKTLSFNADDINWFRIYYSKGDSYRDIGNAEGVFAVSGNQKKLVDLKIKNKIENIFNLLAKAKIEKTDYKYGIGIKRNGRPEFIRYRFKFNNPPVNNFEELSIYIIIESERGIKEKDEDFIEVTHSYMNRYFISKLKNPKLFQALEELAYYNYGNNLEKRP